jgi:hypothetical protein
LEALGHHHCLSATVTVRMTTAEPEPDHNVRRSSGAEIRAKVRPGSSSLNRLRTLLLTAVAKPWW